MNEKLINCICRRAVDISTHDLIKLLPSIINGPKSCDDLNMLAEFFPEVVISTGINYRNLNKIISEGGRISWPPSNTGLIADTLSLDAIEDDARANEFPEMNF